MPDNIAAVLRPDYTLPLSSVYIRTAQAFMVNESLDALREGNPWGLAQCPSWAADWLWPGRVRNSRVEKSFWGPAYLFPDGSSRFKKALQYRASGEVKAAFSFSGDGSLLSCAGFIVDRISGLSARGVGYFSWDVDSIVQPTGYRSIHGSYEKTRGALFRMLIADRAANGGEVSPRHAVILNLPSTLASGGRQFAKRDWKFLSGQTGY